MFWKNWPYWLKGGIILFLYSLSAVVMFANLNHALPVFVSVIFLPVFIPAWFCLTWLCGIGGLSHGVLASCYTSGIWIFIYSLPVIIFFFVFGAIIGLIYGKIKNIIKK
ncbi:MAG: hypothetical protein A2402_03235 [Candidatus Staskawiczbacteria bacterium RIFOXYC1_FULL_37_43]|nr:MAG: hypothetical protein A2813_02990 [Candidatus Staskawiczbacteria bacterium RIFCSPHIGHO2_01_FULL_37_17]OGZ71603.1 MAG: hypothetical protein A2891_02825 [Candidatus Staskawiczbacteria bacterium RIFCSPLOWO2_01_FULL_37_19]OGZ76357.1 MAG: hypothetical protein A2205_01185 [Candidatus Staskawiczbacteria bacterium RIFOXYA1_FULL_37_15]OGZ77362.1 MAG: hypothetical protein A2280_00610 [Candidatus Staskawiczbacteria bacterium RIFOXYA12_FULL_37_10]OGZ80373.1 MAG: hypothetical protein A2353_03895 [Can